MGKSGVGVVLYPDPEQGSGDTKLKSLVLTTENVVINQNKNTCSIKPKMEMNFSVQ